MEHQLSNICVENLHVGFGYKWFDQTKQNTSKFEWRPGGGGGFW